jgi:8-oxo-dGTP pyrophosphatase MutT (NUDIX family)
VRLSKLVRDRDGWETKSSATRYADQHLEVVTEDVKAPGRTSSKAWTTVRRKSFVVIAPMTRDGKFLLVQQERIPIRSTIWEMPAGQIDETLEPGPEQMETAALRELCEETGYELAADGELVALGHFFASPGFTDEHGFFFLARPVERCRDTARNETESILDCRAFTMAELRGMIGNDEIIDANTLGMCARLAARGYFTFEAL